MHTLQVHDFADSPHSSRTSLSGWYTISTAAARLKKSYPTIRRWIASGAIPAPQRVGSEVRWPAEVLEFWIAQGYPRRANG